jgi:hypothetical protein
MTRARFLSNKKNHTGQDDHLLICELLFDSGQQMTMSEIACELTIPLDVVQEIVHESPVLECRGFEVTLSE